MALKDMRSIYGPSVGSLNANKNKPAGSLIANGNNPMDKTGWSSGEKWGPDDIFPYGLWSDRGRTKLRKSNYSL